MMFYYSVYPDAYQNFINKYGTHVVQWGLFGGEAVMLAVVDNAYCAEYSDFTLALNAKLQFMVLKGSSRYCIYIMSFPLLSVFTY